MMIPYVGTLAWINFLNMTTVDGWRPWTVDGQIAGLASNLFFLFFFPYYFCNSVLVKLYLYIHGENSHTYDSPFFLIDSHRNM